MKENSIRRAVREGRVALGTGVREFATRGIPRLIEAGGFDYCQIDMEHGAFDIETLANLAEWFSGTSISPMVRIHKVYMHFIPAILDQGITGIQVSSIENEADARALVNEAKYPPLGNRGISQMGAHTNYKGYGKNYQTEYIPWANENVIVCASLESLEGVGNVDAIAAVPGIDMIAYGHSDLSARLGIHLDLDNPRFVEVIRSIADACKKHGKLARGSPSTEDQMELYYKLGCRVFSLPGTDITVYRDALKARSAAAHKRLKSIGVPVPG